jgi:hypothetical protein
MTTGDVVRRAATSVDGAVDTCGAGDAFIASYLERRLAGRRSGTVSPPPRLPERGLAPSSARFLSAPSTLRTGLRSRRVAKAEPPGLPAARSDINPMRSSATCGDPMTRWINRRLPCLRCICSWLANIQPRAAGAISCLVELRRGVRYQQLRRSQRLLSLSLSPRLSCQQHRRRERAMCRAFGDGPGRDRTCDLGIKSPLLYQLSYRPRC